MLLEQCEEVLSRSAWVSIDDERLRAIAASAPDHLLAVPRWQADPAMFSGHADATVTWLVTTAAIAFHLWPRPGERPWYSQVDGQLVGQEEPLLGLLAVIGRAVHSGVPFGDWRWVAQLDEDELAAILAPAPGGGRLPMMAERLACLRELGAATRAYSGPASLLEAARGSAIQFVDRLVSAAPSFADSYTVSGQPLVLHSRAWRCAAMLYGRFLRDPIRRFTDPHAIPPGTDHRLPQALRGMGVLRLSADLAARIDAAVLIPEGSDEEIALRAATVAAVGRIQDQLSERIPGISALQIDHFLFRTAVEAQDRLPPFHRTTTTRY